DRRGPGGRALWSQDQRRGPGGGVFLRLDPSDDRPLRSSLPDDLHQHALPAPAIELPIEDLLPGPEIQAPPAYRHDHLTPHDLAFHVRVGVVLSGAVVAILARGL